MLTFKKVKFKNFGSFGNVFTEIQLDKYNTVLVSGRNGHGKSFALLDAITFGLFGRPFRKVNIPQLVNTVNQKDCVVEVYFSTPKHEYRIVRGMQPKIFEIYKDGVLLHQHAKAKDYQRLLEEQILRMNYKSFTQIVILGSSSFVPFMQLTPADRREVIEDILDIKIFSVMNSLLKSKVSELKESLNIIQNKIDIANEKINLQERHVTALETKSQERIDKNENKIQSLVEEGKFTESDMTKMSNKIDKIRSSIPEKDQFLVSLKNMEKTENTLESDIKRLHKDIIFYTSNTSCPSCKQEIAENFRQETLHQKAVDKINLEERLEGVEKLITNTLNEINSIEDKENDIRKQEKIIVEQQSTLKSLYSQIQYIEQEIKDIQTNSDNIDDERNKLQEFMKDKGCSLDEKETVLNQKHNYDIVNDLLKDAGIKSKIIKYYLPIMNKLINKYLSSMNFFANFTLDEEFNETIKSRHRDTFSYMSFSEGEKLRIDLALILSWREIAKIKNSANCNLLILDEVFDSSLDSMGTDDLMKLLEDLSINTNIFVISHKADQLSDKFANYLVFEKKNNFSRIK
jgi:DNA repair exonuclease SbcCD ATPase subunit